MACYEDYIFQEYIDGELEISTCEELEEHLLQCTKCRQCLEKVREVNGFVSQHIDDELLAHEKNINKGVLIFMKNYKRIAIAACAVVLTVSLGAGHIKALANSIMVLFKPQTIQSVKVSDVDIKKWQDLKDSFDVLTVGEVGQSSGKRSGEAEMGLLGKVSYECNGEYKNDLTIAKAKELIPFDLKAPIIDGKPMESLSIIPERSYTITLNKTISNSLQKSGLEPLTKDMLGKTITLKVPAKVYGMHDFKNHTWAYVEQTTVPEVISTDGIDYDRLCSIFKELPLMPESIRSQIKNIDDLKNTLPLVFKDNVKEISLNGAKAYICQIQKQETVQARKADGSSDGVQVAPEMNEVKWMQNGILWSVSGTLTRDEIINIVEKIQ